MAKAQLFNLPDNEVQQWKDFNIEADRYNFSHLNARKLNFSHPERNENYTLYFTFSHHVFTRSIKEDEYVEPSLIYPHPSDIRAFDTLRFELSMHLPHIVETLPNQFCYHGGYSRYCSCKISLVNRGDMYYQVVYRVWKTRGKMRFHVESAYPLDERPRKVKKVNFWVICHNLLTGKKLPEPAK